MDLESSITSARTYYLLRILAVLGSENHLKIRTYVVAAANFRLRGKPEAVN
jgi:hypothetical protein